MVKKKETVQKKFVCPGCGGPRNHNILCEIDRTPYKDEFIYNDTWYVLECAGCNSIKIANEVTTENDYYFDEETGETEWLPTTTEYQKPNLRKRLNTSRIPHYEDEISSNVSKCYNEVYQALANGMTILASSGARTIIDCIITNISGNRGNFPQKVDRLQADGTLTALQAETLK